MLAQLRWGQNRWQQGQHVSILGPNGSGKTYLALRLLELQRYTLIFGTKPVDSELSTYTKKHNYERLSKWPPSDWSERVILWPKYKKPGDELQQRHVFKEAIDEAFYSGAWTILVDEIYYWSNILKLTPQLSALWTQGRSLKLALVGCTQRPKAVPLLMYDQAIHLFFFRFGDENDLKRIGGIGYLDRKEIAYTVAHLQRHEFLYINAITGQMTVSRVST